jgi:hypothetical protein
VTYSDRTLLKVALGMATLAVLGAIVFSDHYLLGFAVVPLGVAAWFWWDSRSK